MADTLERTARRVGANARRVGRIERWVVGSVATLSDGGLPDGGVPESPGRSDAANKGWLTPLESPEFGNEIAYTDLLQVAKMRTRYMYVARRMRTCERERGSLLRVYSTDPVDTPRA